MKTKTLFTALALVLLLAIVSMPAWAAGGPPPPPPPKDEVVMVIHNNQSNGGVPVVYQGVNQHEAFLDYNITAGQSISDTIQMDFSMIDNDADCTDAPILGFNIVGSLAAATSVSPSTVQPTDCAGITSATITINTGPLAAGDYNVNVQVKFDPPNQGGDFNGPQHDTVHIHVHVEEGPTVSCFITDSDFNFLLDCAGNPVTSGDGGRFTIVTNKKNIEVATNPGQFYYNVLWTNSTGSDVTVRVTFVRTGVHAHGTQAIHGSLFPNFPVLNSTSFQQVNDDIPSGADDVFDGIVVPAGYTLWVDYHLEWDGLGLAAPGTIGTSCATANQAFHVTATLTNLADNSIIGTCTAGAIGYKK